MVTPEEVKTAIQRVLPKAQVTIEDLSGTGDHLQVSVISSKFDGLSRVRQHQLIYEALSNEIASEAIHALALTTSVPS
ncbi:BolA/IbaG family iron-sulfur metabolism protein [Prochlorococcus sp. MIT 1341]|uniref:BolA/IbaG family iron-sulfur metabolism protein n=1 Tax=Prochlorococcus sp. MIT 1341 TaxID=3096221 RepID=UPI002A74D423|nr:BolA/IbaG family iron-sulfur metabolism protein [Prochlorococcus sp. MIT 1341]